MAFSCALLFSCASGNDLKGRTNTANFMDDVERRSNLVRQFRAEFEKTRKTSVFDRAIKVKGELIFQKPNRFRLALSGDINVEIMSDGEAISVVHDGIDREIFKVYGERDASKFADPLMILLENIGNGGLRRFAVSKEGWSDDEMILEVKPVDDNKLERIQTVEIRLAESGEIRKVLIVFKDGDQDETIFTSWSMLASDDPEIMRLNEKLNQLANCSHENEDMVSSTVDLEAPPLTF
jgi:outer membrane lipoprotein-sorting protein